MSVMKKWTEPARRRTILVRNTGLMSMLRQPPPGRIETRCLAFPEVHFAFRDPHQLYAGLVRSRGGLFLPVIGNHVSSGGRVCLGSATPASTDAEDFVDAFWNSVFHVFDEQVGDFQRWQASGDPDDSLRDDQEIRELGNDGFAGVLDDANYVPVNVRARVVVVARERRDARRAARLAADREVEAAPEAEAPPRPAPFYREEESWRVAWRRRRIR